MNRSKKIFFLVAIAFFIFLIYATYDFSRRTTFPGSPKKSARPRASAYDSLPRDSVARDTLR
jgi:hypothetical protein